jgi:triosephosphate isomerase
MRTTIIAGNWKLHKTPSETADFVGQLRDKAETQSPSCGIIVGPPFVSIPAAVSAAAGSSIQVAAQNVYWEGTGAFTGEISAPMLKDAGCTHVIIGHSERRQYFGETDETVNKRIKAAMTEDLVPIFCLGETLDEREAGKTFDIVTTQLQGGLNGITITDPLRFIVAYEPVWAIGTGKTATVEQAQEVHSFLRKKLAAIAGSEAAASIRILYGGSVKPDNAKALMGSPDIDGALIGGASLKVEDFTAIIREST